MSSFPSSFHTARKVHRCSWCPERIDPGERYETWGGVYEGDFGTVRMHLECVKAMRDDGDACCEGWEPHSFQRGSGGDGADEQYLERVAGKLWRPPQGGTR